MPLPNEMLSGITHIELVVFGKPGSGKSTFYRWLATVLEPQGLSVVALDPEHRLIRIMCHTGVADAKPS